MSVFHEFRVLIFLIEKCRVIYQIMPNWGGISMYFYGFKKKNH